VPENALRGEWGLGCDRGRLRLSLTLAPTQPPRVQYLEAVSVLPLSPALEAAAAGLAKGIGRSDGVGSLPGGLAPTADRSAVGRLLAAAAAYGACRVGPTRQGGGDAATVRLLCDSGGLEARMEVDPRGALLSLALTPGPEEACVP